MKIKIIAVDKKTNEILEKVERDNMTSAMVYCMTNESDDITCLIKEQTK